MYKYYRCFKHLSISPCFQLPRLFTQLQLCKCNYHTEQVAEKILIPVAVAIFQVSVHHLEAGSIGHQRRSGNRLALGSAIHFLLNLTANLQLHTF